MPNIKLPSLNGLRALSIIIVIFSHLKIQTPENSVFWRIFKYFPLITDGSFGVNVFFIISGFLITTLLLNEELESGRISLKRF